MQEVVIRNEDDLFENLELAKRGGIGDDVKVVFDGWPKYEMVIKGRQFDGGVPTRVMPKLLEIQKAIRDVYSIQKYGEVQRLNKEEREETELIVKFEAGHSTKFSTDIYPALNTMANNMSGSESVVVIIGVAIVIASAWVGSTYIKKKFKMKLSEQETERIKIVTNLVNTIAQLQIVKNGVDYGHEKVLKSLGDNDGLLLEEGTVIDGKTIKNVLRKPREVAKQNRMDGKFIILNVYSGSVEEGFKIKVRNTENDEELLVNVPEGTLTKEQENILKNSEWGKNPVLMKINYKKLGDIIKDATLIEAGLSESKQ